MRKFTCTAEIPTEVGGRVVTAGDDLMILLRCVIHTAALHCFHVQQCMSVCKKTHKFARSMEQISRLCSVSVHL